MATYYLLPPRAVLADHLVEWLGRALPGVEWDDPTRALLLELVSAVASRPGVHLVHGGVPPRGLAGDEVVEVRPGRSPGEFVTRRYRVGAAAA